MSESFKLTMTYIPYSLSHKTQLEWKERSHVQENTCPARRAAGQIDRHLALVRPDEPASRQLSGEGLHLTLLITFRRYTYKQRMAFLPGPVGLQGEQKKCRAIHR
jgi:hypothetical protein